MQVKSTHVNKNFTKDHYFKFRNFDLAEKVARLPNSALVGAFEIGALTGIAAPSIMKPAQRKSMAFPDPRVVGRMNKWPLGVVRAWLNLGIEGFSVARPEPIHRGRGRPTLASKFASHVVKA